MPDTNIAVDLAEVRITSLSVLLRLNKVFAVLASVVLSAKAVALRFSPKGSFGLAATTLTTQTVRLRKTYKISAKPASIFSLGFPTELPSSGETFPGTYPSSIPILPGTYDDD